MTRFVAIALIAVSSAAQPAVDLSGVWERNKAASSPERQPLDGMKVKIDQHGSTLEITIRAVQRGNLEQVTNRYPRLRSS